MSYFFCVTGFLLFNNLSFENYPIKIKKRVFSLLVPYILWQIITIMIDILQGQYVFRLNDFLTRTFCFTMWPENGAIWYLYAIFFLALISPIILLLFQNTYIGWILVAGLIFLCEIKESINNEIVQYIINYGYIRNILFYMPAYLIGCFYGRLANKNLDSLKYILFLLISAFFVGCTTDNFFANIALKTLPILIILLTPIVPWLENKKIYNLTFLMYVIHQPLISDLWLYIKKIYEKIVMPVSFCNLLTKFIILFSDILVAYIIYLSLKRLSKKGLNILTGGRF